MATFWPYPNKKGEAVWYFKFCDWDGKRRTVKGYSSKAETKHLAEQLEVEAREIRKGYRPKPTPAQQPRQFNDVVAEYLAWGESQGGRHGCPWNKVHLRDKTRFLHFWQEQLGLQLMSDLEGCLPRVEAILRQLQPGHSGKTLQEYANGLFSFCLWSVKRGYLTANPMKNLQPFDTEPEIIRRALTVDEVERLLAVAPDHRRLIYIVALASGLRFSELRKLTVGSLDLKAGGVFLKKRSTKNRKPTFHHLARNVVELLRQVAEGKQATDQLLKIPSHINCNLNQDLEKANIPKHTPEGKIDFHALRTTYATLTIDVGANPKEAQSLARHATIEMTLRYYVRTRDQRLGEIADSVGDIVYKPADCPKAVPNDSTLTGKSVVTLATDKEYMQGNDEAVAGASPAYMLGQVTDKVGQNLTQVGQVQGLIASSSVKDGTVTDANVTNAGQPDCPKTVLRIWPDLDRICEAWPSLPMAIRNEMLALLPVTGFSAFSGVRLGPTQISGFSGFSNLSCVA